ncbi:MAG: CRISPR-associated helicase Cas3' [Anaerolineaceae bacterium]|nr:CRISPR-associated helicase Cas3' [Anaerolineaceae bacterium]
MHKQKIGHIRSFDQKSQSLEEHLLATSEWAGICAEKIGLKDVGQLLGLLHDLGKASDEFQNYILSANGMINPDCDDFVDADQLKGKIDHSSAGAQFLYTALIERGDQGKISAQILALCLASHHSGIIDCISPEGINTFTKRMGKNDEYTHTREVVPFFQEKHGDRFTELLSKNIENQIIQKMQTIAEKDDKNMVIDTQDTLTFKYGLFIRFLFSCLIDGDRLNTADFEMPQNEFLRSYGKYIRWETLIQRLDIKLKAFEKKSDRNNVDQIRETVSQACLNFSSKPKGIFQLNVPTGGGKTLASLRFALHHANTHGMDHIFYIVPFTSIIDQNADEVRKILEEKDERGEYLDKVVLEHHSNLTPEEESRRHNVLAQNWDAPIVFTTQVQFLEALFGRSTRSVRRLHQLANSVIIFDEIQTIPIQCVHMFNLALRFLVHSCGATVVLCTATQPLLDKVEPLSRALSIPAENKIIQNDQELFRQLKRVSVKDQRKPGGWSTDEIAELTIQQVEEKGNVLIIVNTKKSAMELYQNLKVKSEVKTFHLSTNMCPEHRLTVLSELRQKLDDEQPVICVSTQLIEAGVDIDFGTVIRYQAGLDSIVQAAGRCNRHGRRSIGNVYVVNPAEESITRLKDIVIGKSVTDHVWGEYLANPEAFDHDPLGLQALYSYYQYYFYERKAEMSYCVNKKSAIGREDDLFNLLSINTLSVEEYQKNNQSVPDIPFKQAFQSASKLFAVIDQNSRGVIVPYGDQGGELIKDLCATQDIKNQFKLLKKAQRYSVNLYTYEFEKLTLMKVINEVQPGAGIFYMDSQYYSNEFGWSNEPVNDMDTLIG